MTKKKRVRTEEQKARRREWREANKEKIVAQQKIRSARRYSLKKEEVTEANKLWVKNNKEAVKQSVQNLVRMSKFDKPFRPDIDSRIYRLLFEPDTPLTPIELRKSISDVLVRHEPRISLVEIDVQRSVSDSAYNITIRYQIINTPSIEAVKIQLERLV